MRRSRPLRAVLLDRDGTLNVKAPEGSYVADPAELVLLPGAATAVRRLNERGLAVYVVTNQRVVALGRATRAQVDATNRALVERLAGGGARIDGVYVCPHERGACQCRKPLPGLVRQVLDEHPELDLADLALIGDGDGDVRLGESLGIPTVRIGPPHPEDLSTTVARPDIAAAVAWLLADDSVPA